MSTYPPARAACAQRLGPWSADAAGAPIVLMHDSLGCVELWRDFPEQLARETGRSVIAYDRLGFGRSDPNARRLRRPPASVEAEAREGFRQLREALGIGPFVAFGHSVGGGMAICCAGVYESDCQALITESAQAFAERPHAGRHRRRAALAFAEAGRLEPP